jgi:hypothetical protein
MPPDRSDSSRTQAIKVGSSPDAVAIGDVTGDGRNDVVMTTRYYFDAANDYRLRVFVQTKTGSRRPSHTPRQRRMETVPTPSRSPT